MHTDTAKEKLAKFFRNATPAEQFVRDLAEAYHPGTGFKTVTPDEAGVSWLNVGHNASHCFSLGWCSEGQLYVSTCSESLTEPMEFVTQMRRVPAGGSPGYLGHF